MTPSWFFILCEISVIACAVVSGVFLTFSDFVMRSLGGAKHSAGIEAMQIINREVYRSVFMVLLLGMSALSPLLIGYAWFRLAGGASAVITTGGVLYLAGVFAVTLAFNVPMNQRLDGLDFTGAEAAGYWAGTYLPRWTFWNYIRALASAGSAACFLAGSLWLVQG